MQFLIWGQFEVTEGERLSGVVGGKKKRKGNRETKVDEQVHDNWVW